MEDLKLMDKLQKVLDKHNKKDKKKPTQKQIFEKPIFEKPKKTSSNNKNKKY